jgi:glycine/D-amino acid oxidase-like deaminating enzyme
LTVAAAVLGCGGVGGATARLLQRRGWRVRIYARDLPPETTSNIAGAQWLPSPFFPGTGSHRSSKRSISGRAGSRTSSSRPSIAAAMLHDFLSA